MVLPVCSFGKSCFLLQRLGYEKGYQNGIKPLVFKALSLIIFLGCVLR